jgi:predicted nuclease of predicted toxin-antitoxin system
MVRELDMNGYSDSLVFETAVERDAILITKDLEFGSPEHYDLERHTGLVIVRMPSALGAEKISRRVSEAFKGIGIEDLEGVVTILEEGRYRTRNITE